MLKLISVIALLAAGERHSDNAVMETIAAHLTEDEIDQLAAYISGLAE